MTIACRGATSESTFDLSETADQDTVQSNGTDCANRFTCTECVAAAPTCIWSLAEQSCNVTATIRPATPNTTQTITTNMTGTTTTTTTTTVTTTNTTAANATAAAVAAANEDPLMVRDAGSCPVFVVNYTRTATLESVTHKVRVTVSNDTAGAFRALLNRNRVTCEQADNSWPAVVTDGGALIACETRQNYTLSGIVYFTVAVDGVPLMFDDKYDHYLTAYRKGCDFRRRPEAGCANCLWDDREADDGLPRRYYCRWCTRNHLCTGLYQQCDVRKRVGNQYVIDDEVVNRGITVRCPSIGIASFDPEYGPWAGGTTVRIGIRNHALVSEDKLMKVTISGSRCLLPTTSKDGETVTCTISPKNSSILDDGPVEVTYVSGVDKLLPALRLRSEQPFYFVEPEITNVRPACGSVAGGTKLTIRGNFLNAGNSLEVFIRENVSCTITERRQNDVECMTGAVDAPGAGQVRLQFDNYLNTYVAGMEFMYTGEPSVDAGQTFSGIVSGGTTMTLRGHNFGCLHGLLIKIRHNNNQYAGLCISHNDTHIECLTPRIGRSVPSAAMSLKLEIHGTLDRRPVLIYSSAGRNLSYTLHPDPVYTDFETDASGRLVVVNGLRLDRGYQSAGGDLSVRFRQTGTPCNVTSVGPRRVVCRTPASVPAGDEVVINVGQNLVYEVHRKHVHHGHRPHLTILFAGITLVSLIITLVVAAVYCTKIALMAAEHRPVEMQSLCQQMQPIHSSAVTVAPVTGKDDSPQQPLPSLPPSPRPATVTTDDVE